MGESSEVGHCVAIVLDPERRNALDIARSLGSTPPMVGSSVLPLPTHVPAVLGGLLEASSVNEVVGQQVGAGPLPALPDF